MNRTAARPVVFTALSALTYAAAMLVGRLTRLDDSDTALVWPAAAVAVVWLLEARRRSLTGVSYVALVLVTISTNHATDAPWMLSLGFAVVNLLCVTITVQALHWRGHEPRLAEPRDLSRLVGAINVGNVLSAAVGAQVLAMRGADPLAAFVSFGTRNGITLFVGLAAYLALVERRRTATARPHRRHSLRRTLEVPAILGTSVLVFLLVFVVNQGNPFAYLLIPVGVFVGLRLSTAAGVLHTVVLGAAIVTATLGGRGVFVEGDPALRALLAQLLVGCVLLVSLTIALFRDSRTRLVSDLHAANRQNLAAAEQLRRLALYDTLTGLPNRALLRERLERALAVSHRTALAVGVLFLDLNGFKQVNDQRGHAAGDEVLAEVARRLQTTGRPGDTVARLGGDEFVVVCPDLRGADELAAIAHRHAQAVAAPLVLRDGAPVTGLSTSVGSAVSTQGSTADSLLSAADHAMYEAKRGRQVTGPEAAPARG